MPDLSYSALMPPMCLLLATPIGALIALRWRRLGWTVVVLSSLLLYALCTPFVSDRLLIAIENEVPPPSAAALASAEAIVVLGGDIYHGKPGVAPDDVGLLTLDRLRLAAQLYHRRPLPILVTAGKGRNDAVAGATLMAEVLSEDFGIAPSWIEDEAETTFQNATYSAVILKAHHITRAIIVTEAWHMPRAIWSFEHAGIDAIPAPAERTYARHDWSELTPDYKSFASSFFALHEMLGLAVYRHRYGPVKSAAD